MVNSFPNPDSRQIYTQNSTHILVPRFAPMGYPHSPSHLFPCRNIVLHLFAGFILAQSLTHKKYPIQFLQKYPAHYQMHGFFFFFSASTQSDNSCFRQLTESSHEARCISQRESELSPFRMHQSQCGVKGKLPNTLKICLLTGCQKDGRYRD